jgi:hypothetical protein
VTCAPQLPTAMNSKRESSLVATIRLTATAGGTHPRLELGVAELSPASEFVLLKAAERQGTRPIRPVISGRRQPGSRAPAQW